LPTKYPKQRAQITDLAIRTLEDKTATCRKNAIQLLHKLIQTHPFGMMHGGSLDLPVWQTRYDELVQQLEKVDAHELEQAKVATGMVDEEDEDEDEEEEEEVEADEGGEASTPKPKKEKKQKKAKPRHSQLDISALQAEQTNLDPNTVLQLRLAKKYYSDALRFINAIEGAVPILAQLLVSTNKSEALEAIRFFRIAYEYKFTGAEVGIKTMIHLIWTKDNNATGPVDETEGGKGIRGSLIETYKSLYFDVVPDLNPKQQVNRIAKNMIERTYDATLAELTSLEELMRTMMMEGGVDGGVHEDIINKLWQVYCESRSLHCGESLADGSYRYSCSQVPKTGSDHHPWYAGCCQAGSSDGASRKLAQDRSRTTWNGECPSTNFTDGRTIWFSLDIPVSLCSV
jgi:condensin complex subunit 1